MVIEQSSFAGGMDMFNVDTAIDNTSYRTLINARSRFGELRPVHKSTLTGLPAGKKQGGIGVGNISIAFVAGNAYYQLQGQSGWTQILGFSMDAVADRLWAIAIPKSSKDYIRKLGDSINNPMLLSVDFSVAGTPAGILVQDGLTQPWLIQFNAATQTFIARLTKTFSAWQNTSTIANDREYVPIGRQMMFLNQKLFIVAPDRKSVYQSVTGRALDFMVNVDFNGNKLATEARGGAATVAFAADNNDITCLRVANTPDSFLYATGRHVRLLQLDYDNTVFGEPTWSQAAIVEAGVLNQECLTEILGDYAFLDAEGVKSFNAVQSLQVEGRNSIFSLQIAALLENKIQTIGASISFNNYALFYVDTTLGRGICVYDMLRQKWDAVDITALRDIKQFWTVTDGETQKLFACNNTSVWEMYVAEETETAILYTKAWLSDNLAAEHKSEFVWPIFRGSTRDGTLAVREYVDEKQGQTENRPIENSTMAMVWPLSFPIGFDSKPNMRNNSVVIANGNAGKKLAYVIRWDTDAALRGLQIVSSEQQGNAAIRQ